MKLSVALCTYNGEQFIKKQLDSILNQSVAVDEIIICDDCSRDNTIQIIEQYQQDYPQRISLFINETNLKSVKNFEKAITLCSGDVIFLSDQDDIWVTTKVENYLIFFNNNRNINVLASNGYCIDENSKVHEKYSLWDVPHFLKEIGIEIDYFETITRCSNIATGASLAIRKEFMREILPFPIISNYHHDEWIAVIAASQKSFELINDRLFYYRIHKNQQVGGVFFEKNNTEKNKLITFFNFKSYEGNFINYKRKLNKLVHYINNISELIKQCNEKHHEMFKKSILKVEGEYYKTISLLERKYPIQYFLLRLSDKVLNKKKRLLK